MHVSKQKAILKSICVIWLRSLGLSKFRHMTSCQLVTGNLKHAGGKKDNVLFKDRDFTSACHFTRVYYQLNVILDVIRKQLCV